VVQGHLPGSVGTVLSFWGSTLMAKRQTVLEGGDGIRVLNLGIRNGPSPCRTRTVPVRVSVQALVRPAATGRGGLALVVRQAPAIGRG